MISFAIYDFHYYSIFFTLIIIYDDKYVNFVIYNKF